MNSLIYWLSQMVGSFALGQILDSSKLRRKHRAMIGWVITLIFVFAVWGGTYHVQTTFERLPPKTPHYLTDVYSSEYGGLAVLYACMGLLDSITQCFTYWLFSAMSNDMAKLAHYVGFYKSIQSAGASVAFSVDGRGNVPYMNELAASWALNAGGLLFALPVVLMRVKDTTAVEGEKTVEGREKEIEEINHKVLAERQG